MQKLTKVVVFCVCLLPFFFLVIRIIQNDLGPDPAQELSKETGEWTLRFLLIVLCVTPLRQISGIATILRHRRMLGLFVLFYASCHFFSWIAFLLGFRWTTIVEEIIERPYISVGFSAYLILLALGITSPRAMVRRLGQNWKKLHRLVYLAAILGVVHLLWILRLDISEAVLYGALVFVLLGYRLIYYLSTNKKIFP